MENNELNLREVFKYDDKKNYLNTEEKISNRIVELLTDKNKIKQLSKSKVASDIRSLFGNMIQARKKNDRVRKFLSDKLFRNTNNETVYNLLNIDEILTKYGVPKKFPKKFMLNLKELYIKVRENLDADDKVIIDKDIPRTWDATDDNVESKKEILTNVLNRLIEQQKGTNRQYTQGINLMAAILIDRKLKEKPIVDRKLKGIGVDSSPNLFKKDISEIVNTLDIMCEIYDDIFIILSLAGNQVLYDKFTKYSKLKQALELIHEELNDKLKNEGYEEINIKSFGFDSLVGPLIQGLCLTPREGIEKLNRCANREIGSDVADGLMQVWIDLVKKSTKQKDNSNILKECAEEIVYKTLMLSSTPNFIDAFFACGKQMSTFKKEEKKIMTINEQTNDKTDNEKYFFSNIEGTNLPRK